MTNRDSQGVACILGFDPCIEGEKRMYHHLDLLLFGSAIADYAGLYFERRVFANRKSGFGNGEEHNAARVRQLQGRLHILRVEDLFDGR